MRGHIIGQLSWFKNSYNLRDVQDIWKIYQTERFQYNKSFSRYFLFPIIKPWCFVSFNYWIFLETCFLCILDQFFIHYVKLHGLVERFNELFLTHSQSMILSTFFVWPFKGNPGYVLQTKTLDESLGCLFDYLLI